MLFTFFQSNLKKPTPLYYSTFFQHTSKNEAGCSNGLWDIDCQRGNHTMVTSKTAISHTGQF